MGKNAFPTHGYVTGKSIVTTKATNNRARYSLRTLLLFCVFSQLKVTAMFNFASVVDCDNLGILHADLNNLSFCNATCAIVRLDLLKGKYWQYFPCPKYVCLSSCALDFNHLSGTYDPLSS